MELIFEKACFDLPYIIMNLKTEKLVGTQMDSCKKQADLSRV